MSFERIENWLFDGPWYRGVLGVVAFSAAILGIGAWLLMIADEDCTRRGKHLKCIRAFGEDDRS